MRAQIALVSAFGLVLLSRPVAGQAWDAPSFFSPLPMDDIGFYLADPQYADLGVQGIWRQSGNLNLGLRAGLAGRHGDRGALVGAEFYGPLQLADVASPVVLSWVVGLGATFRNASYVRIPAGISIGAIFGDGTNLSVVPYAYPRVALDIYTVGSGDNEDTLTRIRVPLDLGVDFAVGSSYIVRFGVTFDRADAVGIGGAVRIPRGARVH